MIITPTPTMAVTAAVAGCLLLAGCNNAARPGAAPKNQNTGQPATAAAVAADDAATQPSSGSADRCALLTQAEVDTAVGQPLGAGKGGQLHDCVWASATSPRASTSLCPIGRD
jgi:hypothetical protein